MASRGGSLIHALFGFSGRMKRLDFWMASAGLAVAHVVLLVLILAIAFRSRLDSETGRVVRGVVDLAFLWPSLAIAVRRGHDRGRPAAYSAIVVAAAYGAGSLIGYLVDAGLRKATGYAGMIAIVGWAYLLISYGLIDGTRGPNRYGPSPKGRQAPGVGADLAEVFD